MLRIVVVDDEVLIREGLTRMINKESGCFHIVGSFPGGQEALDVIPELDVDVVITDIRMPGVDGLTLIKTLKVTHPRIRTILMSGFTEFNYAREAIRASVVDYLLKPINKDQLFELLYRLDEEMRQSAERETRLRGRLLESLLHTDSASVSERVLQELQFPYPHAVLMAHKAEEPAVLEEGINRLKQKEPPVFDRLDIHDRLQILVFYYQGVPAESELKELAEPLLAAGRANQSAVHVGVSRDFQESTEVRAAYLEAKQACDRGIYGGSLLHFAYVGDLRIGRSKASPPPLTDWQELREPLALLDLPVVLGRIKAEWEHLTARNAGPEEIVRTFRALEEITEKELPEYETFRARILPEGLESLLLYGMNVRVMQQQCLGFFTEVLEHVAKLRGEHGGKAVEQVKRWIAANYNQHVELNALAAMVFLTPSYLSKLFKQETGLTLTEYLTDIRIRQAKQLLRGEPGLKVHKIGAEVGYPDPAYFNKLFKRVVGVTPNEYKRIRQ